MSHRALDLTPPAIPSAADLVLILGEHADSVRLRMVRAFLARRRSLSGKLRSDAHESDVVAPLTPNMSAPATGRRREANHPTTAMRGRTEDHSTPQNTTTAVTQNHHARGDSEFLIARPERVVAPSSSPYAAFRDESQRSDTPAQQELLHRLLRDVEVAQCAAAFRSSATTISVEPSTPIGSITLAAEQEVLMATQSVGLFFHDHDHLRRHICRVVGDAWLGSDSKDASRSEEELLAPHFVQPTPPLEVSFEEFLLIFRNRMSELLRIDGAEVTAQMSSALGEGNDATFRKTFELLQKGADPASVAAMCDLSSPTTTSDHPERPTDSASHQQHQASVRFHSLQQLVSQFGCILENDEYFTAQDIDRMERLKEEELNDNRRRTIGEEEEGETPRIVFPTRRGQEHHPPVPSLAASPPGQESGPIGKTHQPAAGTLQPSPPTTSRTQRWLSSSAANAAGSYAGGGASSDVPQYLPSERPVGHVPGYEFKDGPRGLGYYYEEGLYAEEVIAAQRAEDRKQLSPSWGDPTTKEPGDPLSAVRVGRRATIQVNNGMRRRSQHAPSTESADTQNPTQRPKDTQQRRQTDRVPMPPPMPSYLHQFLPSKWIGEWTNPDEMEDEEQWPTDGKKKRKSIVERRKSLVSVVSPSAQDRDIGVLAMESSLNEIPFADSVNVGHETAQRPPKLDVASVVSQVMSEHSSGTMSPSSAAQSPSTVLQQQQQPLSPLRKRFGSLRRLMSLKQDDDSFKFLSTFEKKEMQSEQRLLNVFVTAALHYVAHRRSLKETTVFQALIDPSTPEERKPLLKKQIESDPNWQIWVQRTLEVVQDDELHNGSACHEGSDTLSEKLHQLDELMQAAGGEGIAGPVPSTTSGPVALSPARLAQFEKEMQGGGGGHPTVGADGFNHHGDEDDLSSLDSDASETAKEAHRLRRLKLGFESFMSLFDQWRAYHPSGSVGAFRLSRKHHGQAKAAMLNKQYVIDEQCSVDRRRVKPSAPTPLKPTNAENELPSPAPRPPQGAKMHDHSWHPKSTHLQRVKGILRTPSPQKSSAQQAQPVSESSAFGPEAHSAPTAESQDPSGASRGHPRSSTADLKASSFKNTHDRWIESERGQTCAQLLKTLGTPRAAARRAAKRQQEAQLSSRLTEDEQSSTRSIATGGGNRAASSFCRRRAEEQQKQQQRSADDTKRRMTGGGTSHRVFETFIGESEDRRKWRERHQQQRL